MRSIYLAVTIAGLMGCGGATPETTNRPAATACARGRTFVLVRHAEKATTDPADRDPPLSDRGRARATMLASMLGDAGVTRLIATPYKRTQETLRPLGEKLSVQVEVRPPDKTKELVEELRGAPDGAVIVVATHSNVLPKLAQELGHTTLRGVSGDAIPESDFSRVVVVTDACGTARVLELRSGDQP
jgi:phosphohistidine phosphatase SixA